MLLIRHLALLAAALLICAATVSCCSSEPTDCPPAEVPTPPPTKEALTKDPELFLSTLTSALKWNVSTEPCKIAGPIHFVGTKGLGVYLITTSHGHILLNTGLAPSGPMIEASIRKLGFNPQDIKLLLAGHAHVDHVGGHHHIQKSSGAQVAVVEAERELIECGGKTDFHYAKYRIFSFKPVTVDRVLKDGETIRLGDVEITVLHTPGHTKGSTTFTMNVTDGGKSYAVAFPQGTGINPGYRIRVNPSYPGIEDDYRRTLQTLEGLKPDIWLDAHTETFAFEAKRKLAETKGVEAWIDPEGYRKRIAEVRAKLEATIKAELDVGDAKQGS